MYLIEFYILKRIFTLFISVFIAATGLVWVVQLLERISFLTMSRKNFLEFIYFSLLFLPPVLPLVLPFAFVIATSSIFSTMNKDSELVSISAAGLPLFVLWRPVLAFSFILSIFSFLLTNFVAPHTRLSIRHIIANSHPNLIASSFLEKNVFHTLNDGIHLQIGKHYADGTIGELFIVDQRTPETDVFYYAQKGRIFNNQNMILLNMHNGELQRRDTKSGAISIIRFNSYTLNLEEFLPNRQAIVLYPKDHFLTNLITPDPKDSYYEKYPLQYKAELHKRLTSWLYPFLFALVVLTISGFPCSYRQMPIPVSLLSGIFSLFLFWIEHFLAEQAKNNSVWIPCLYIIPVFMSAGMLFLLFTNKNSKIYFFLNDMLCFSSAKKIGRKKKGKHFPFSPLPRKES